MPLGAIWGKQVWSKGPRSLAAGIFQHFDYYDSELKSNSSQTVAPYRISEAAAVGGGLIYYKRGTPDNKVDVYAELYGTGVALGASISDYLRLEERDYNLGSGYSVKAFTGLAYDKRWAFLIDLENLPYLHMERIRAGYRLECGGPYKVKRTRRCRQRTFNGIFHHLSLYVQA